MARRLINRMFAVIRGMLDVVMDATANCIVVFGATGLYFPRSVVRDGQIPFLLL